jgi:uncharacterized membrane protein HdeD (DUF308 family)
MSSPEAAELRRMTTGAWAWLAVGGVVSLVIGIIAIAWPDVTATLIGLFFGLWLLVAGVARLGLSFVMSGWPAWRRILAGLFGVALVVIGILGLLNTAGSARALAVLIGIGFLIAAVADLATALTGRGGRSRAATLAIGAIHLVIGIVFVAWPDTGLRALSVTLGVILVVLGVLQLVAALAIRQWLREVTDQMRTGPDEPKVIGYEIL